MHLASPPYYRKDKSVLGWRFVISDAEIPIVEKNILFFTKENALSSRSAAIDTNLGGSVYIIPFPRTPAEINGLRAAFSILGTIVPKSFWSAYKTKIRPLIEESARLAGSREGERPEFFPVELCSRIHPNYQPEPHQWGFLSAYAMQGQRVMQLDLMGMGKTLQSLMPIIAFGYERVVVVVKTVAYDTFVYTLEDIVNTGLPVFVIDKKLTSSSLSKKKKAYIENALNSEKGILITHYEILEAVLPHLSAFNPDYVILDEGHKILNPESKMGKAGQDLIRNTPACFWASATPYPMVRKFFPILNAVKPYVWGTYDQFVNRYTEKEIQILPRRFFRNNLAEFPGAKGANGLLLKKMAKARESDLAKANPQLSLIPTDGKKAGQPFLTEGELDELDCHVKRLKEKGFIRGFVDITSDHILYRQEIDNRDNFVEDEAIRNEFFDRLRSAGAVRRSPGSALKPRANIVYFIPSGQYLALEKSLRKEKKHHEIPSIAFEEKKQRMLTWYEDFFSETPDEKIVIYVENQYVGEDLKQWLEQMSSKYDFTFVTRFGKHQSENLERTFQNDPRCRVALLSYSAARESLTLTAARHWSCVQPSSANYMWQAMYRVFRMCQKRDPVYHIFILARSYEQARLEKTVSRFIELDAALDKDIAKRMDAANLLERQLTSSELADCEDELSADQRFFFPAFRHESSDYQVQAAINTDEEIDENASPSPH